MFFKTKDEALKYEKLMKERAYTSVPPKYHDFIKFISQKAKIQGGHEIFIQLPYVTVDGRIKWAWDDHRANDKKLSIKTRLCQIADRLFVMAEADSEMLGHATGTAEVQFAEKGVNSTNPFENAETSAVGRALGFLGYGIIGTGIAAADEVEYAHAREALERKVTPIRKESDTSSVAPATPITAPASKKPDSIVITGHVMAIEERTSNKGTRYLAVGVKTASGSEVTVFFLEGDFDIDQLFLYMQPGENVVIEAKEEQNVLIALSCMGKEVS